MNFAPFVHENIRFMSIDFPRNFFTTPKHLIMVDVTDCLGKYITTCIHIYTILACEKKVHLILEKVCNFDSSIAQPDALSVAFCY